METTSKDGTYLTGGDIVRLIANGKYVILTTMALCVFVALAVSLTSTKIYRASYTVTAADDDAASSLSSAFSAIPLLGGTAQRPDFILYQSLLVSVRMGQAIAMRPDLVADILPPDWDKDIDPKADRKTIMALAISGFLGKYLSVSQTEFPAQYAVVLDSKHPEFALALLKFVHQDANDIVRDMRQTRAISQRAHLMSELNQTTVADYRQMLLQLLSRVESQIVTSSMQGEFAAKIVDGPFVNPTPVFPKTRLFAELAVIGGALLGMLLVVFTPLSDSMLFRLIARLRSHSGPLRAVRQQLMPRN